MRTLALLPVFLLAGCAALSGDKLALRDVPFDPAVVPNGLAVVPVQLQVEALHAVEPLADVRIAIHDESGEYSVLPGTRWREPAPELVRGLLLQALEECRCLGAAQRAGSAARADYLLGGELRELAIVQAGSAEPLARARLSLALIRVRDGVVVAATGLERESSLRSRDDESGIAALAVAANQLAGAVVAWAHEVLRTQPAAVASH